MVAVTAGAEVAAVFARVVAKAVVVEAVLAPSVAALEPAAPEVAAALQPAPEGAAAGQYRLLRRGRGAWRSGGRRAIRYAMLGDSSPLKEGVDGYERHAPAPPSAV